MKKYVLLLCCLFGSMGMAFAQTTYTLSGVVTDETNETLPGVGIYIKNSPGVGVITDVNGTFTIKAEKNDVIVFSYMGFQPFEQLVTGNQTGLRIQLSPLTQALEETVVVGMGTQRKISVVGAVTNVDMAQLQTPATNINNMLGGRVPGIISLQRSGEPGKNISEFWIRGIGTFGANSSALVLIDGMEGNLSEIDPTDIESFSVLKDASATAVYGVRGANGVILVTTKRGSADKLQITFRGDLTLSHLVNMPRYLGAYDYAKLANEANVARGNSPLYSDMELNLIKYGLDPDLYPNVNWQNEVLNRNSLQQTYYVNAKGGGDLARYYLSLGTSEELAAYKQDAHSKYATQVGYRTYNYRVNLDINLTKTTTVYFGSDGFVSQKSEPGNADTDALWATQLNLTPLTIPKTYSTGQLPAYGADNAYSPYVMLNYTGMSKTRRYSGKSTLELKQDLSMLTKGLSARAQIAYSTNSSAEEIRYVRPAMYYAETRRYTGELGLYKKLESQSVNYSHNEDQYYKLHFESMLNYDRTFATYHRLTGLVYYYMSSEQSMNNGNESKSEVLQSMYAIPIRYQGISSRVTYGYNDTYFMDVNFGYTGSENFAKNRRFGFFPSVALGWAPTSYQWTQDNLPFVNFFKIRGSYGMVGNDRLTSDRFPYLTLLSETTSGGGWGSTTGTIYEEVIGADNLQWEVARKADVGIDAKFFDESVDLTVDFFRDYRDGIYQKRELIPDYVGLQQMPYGNVGKMVSFGSDGNIAYRHRINKDMGFTLRANYTYSNNKVENWEQALQKYDYQNLTGYGYNIFRGYVAMGLFKDEEDIAASPKQTFGDYLPGDIKYKDVNGDGVINDDDKVPLSYSNYPHLMYGFGGEFNYKKLTVGVLFKGTGNTDYYYVDADGNATGGRGYIPFYGGKTGNVLSIVADQKNRWTPASYSGDPSTENPNARFPRLSYGNNENNSQLSTFWHANSRYLRLSEISVNYNLTAGDFLKKAGIRSVDLQLVGSDLFIWSPVTLWDAEQATQNGSVYPIPQRFAFQVYVNF